jgi:hypothetical protein
MDMDVDVECCVSFLFSFAGVTDFSTCRHASVNFAAGRRRYLLDRCLLTSGGSASASANRSGFGFVPNKLDLIRFGWL